MFLGLIVPHIDTSRNLYSELIQEFHRNGHEVIVVAPVREGTKNGLQVEGGIKVLRIKTLELFKVGKVYKALANLLLPYQFYRGLRRNRIDLNFDLVIIHTPPITLYPVARKIKSRYGAKVYLILRDIFPQNAVDLGLMRDGGPAHRMFRAQEKAMYRICDAIGCMSPGNSEYILKHNPGIMPDKVHQLPNWMWPSPYPAHHDDVMVRRQYGFGEKFVVIFGGNIGKPQKMENIVALARACADHEDILFAIFGDGTEKAPLVELIHKSGLTNIQVFDGLPGPEYFRVLQVADVGLISLSENFTIPNTPSKIMVYFNAKKPILAAIDRNTDIGLILENIGAGLWAEANHPEAIKAKLLHLYHDAELRAKMGENGYRHLLENLTPDIAYETIVRSIN